MRKIVLYIAMSLDGKIARPNGDVGWLDKVPNPDKTDYGYGSMLESIDTTLMGYKTYHQVQQFEGEFPYIGLTNYVFSRQPNREKAEYVEFVSGDIADFVKELKTKPGKDIWLIGGGQINARLLSAQLIDEIQLFVMPVVIGAGIPLFSSISGDVPMRLVESVPYGSGVTLLKYHL